MSSIQSPMRSGSFLLIALLALACWASLAAAQADASGEVPRNAHSRPYGGGWVCDRGFVSVREVCVAIELPNAHLDSSGNGWACDPGYLQQGETCTADAG